MAFRRSRNYAHKAARRQTLWLPLAVGTDTLTSASSATLVASLNAAALALRPFTIVRTRGILELHSDQQATTESQQVGFGQCVVSDQAAAIGITAVPTPDTDASSDLWFVYEWMMSTQRIITQVGFEEPSSSVHYFDSKAMRKVPDGGDLITVIEASSISSGLIIVSQLRTLIKLH